MERQYSVFLGNAGGCSDRYCSSYAKDALAATRMARGLLLGNA